MKIIYLKPRASFRNNLRSDTIWGLICWGIRNLYSEEKLNEFLDEYQKKKVGMLKVSSAFPYFEREGRKEPLFPRPQMKPFDWNSFFEGKTKKEKADAISSLKKFKKANLVTRETFERIMKGELDEASFFANKDLWLETPGGKFTTVDVMHNTIDRLTNSTLENALFTKEETFADGGGLYFLMDGRQENTDMAMAALRFYSHTGFGGDSSTGKNHFTVEIQDIGFPEISNAGCFITLSLYHPEDNEIRHFQANGDYSWYELESRKGKVGGQFLKVNDFWKNSVMMFKEGSVFKAMDKEHYGRNIIIKQKNDEIKFNVQQFGIAFNLPISIKE